MWESILLRLHCLILILSIFLSLQSHYNRFDAQQIFHTFIVFDQNYFGCSNIEFFTGTQ